MLVRVDPDAHDDPREDPRRSLDDVEMAEGDRVKGTGVDGSFSLLERFSRIVQRARGGGLPVRSCGLCRYGWHERLLGLCTPNEPAAEADPGNARNSAWTDIGRKVLYGTEGGIVSGTSWGCFATVRCGVNRKLVQRVGGQPT
jgi:hypothetical protein